MSILEVNSGWSRVINWQSLSHPWGWIVSNCIEHTDEIPNEIGNENSPLIFEGLLRGVKLWHSWIDYVRKGEQ